MQESVKRCFFTLSMMVTNIECSWDQIIFIAFPLTQHYFQQIGVSSGMTYLNMINITTSDLHNGIQQNMTSENYPIKKQFGKLRKHRTYSKN
jgi:hypothetical protein